MTQQPTKRKDFIDWVQAHERDWGQETYPDRPQLKDILQSPVVVFWENPSQEKRLTITLHNDFKELEEVLTRMLFRSSVEIPKRRVALVYFQQKRMGIKQVQVQFEPME